MKGIKHNNITISVRDWKPWRKLPVLVVEIGEENTQYKVASFNSEETAKWFCDVCEEFFEGCIRREEE